MLARQFAGVCAEKQFRGSPLAELGVGSAEIVATSLWISENGSMHLGSTSGG